MYMRDEHATLVFSTTRTIPRKGKPVEGEKDIQDGLRPGKQRVIVRLDRKGRGGKSVTVIEGLPLQQKEKADLLKQLKVRLGAGGTVRDASLEIQGDHCDALMAALEEIGYKPKRSGG